MVRLWSYLTGLIVLLNAYSSFGLSLGKVKPILLLDVDGVINYTGSGGAWHDQKEKTKKTMVDGWEIKWSTDVVSKINYWGKDIADIKWLTTWNEKARLFLSPALGIDEFPLARDPAIRSKGYAAWLVEQNNPGVPICWVDDEVYWFCVKPEDDGLQIESSYWESRPNTLLIEPKEEDGLQPDDLARIESFLLEHTK